MTETPETPEYKRPIEDRIRDSIATKAAMLAAMGQAQPEKPVKRARKKS